MKLTADIIEAFSGVYLSPLYDALSPTPEFHREGWAIYCSDDPAAALAAPRGHAKSTAFTHDFVLANVCFRDACYVIIIGSSEEMAVEHLGDIANELRDNEELRAEFKIKDFIQDQKTDIIVECIDGYQFRILARGAEQKIRGRKWRGRRPDLIVGDDLEDDEQVENKDRRKKFRKWFFRAAKQALRVGGRIRVHGTILQKDALLMHLCHNSSWKSAIYKAHKSFSDFNEILWPERFSETTLRAIRQEFINEGDSAGYAQEMLNDPRDDEGNYLLVEQFLPVVERHADGRITDHRDDYHKMGVGCDFAVSKADAANRTCFVIGGKTISNYLDILDVRVARWDSKEWIDEIFAIHEAWPDATFFSEDGVIWKSVYPFIEEEMARRDIFIDFVPTLPVKDKATRGQTLRKRMKARRARFNKDASWYAEYEEELLDFSATQEADLDDQFDATVTLARGFEGVILEDSDAMSEEEEEFDMAAQLLKGSNSGGRSQTTGY
jgi:predicted phage terminase large subunit-like protein